jgi:hypothetical protein
MSRERSQSRYASYDDILTETTSPTESNTGANPDPLRSKNTFIPNQSDLPSGPSQSRNASYSESFAEENRDSYIGASNSNQCAVNAFK